MRFRKDLGRPGSVRAPAECFGGIDDPVDGRRFSLADHLMSAFAMFPLKYPSLPPSGRDSRRDAIVRGNFRTLSGIAAAPCAPPPCADAPARPAPGSRHRRRDPVREAAARQGAGGPAGFRRPLPDPGRRHRPFGPESVHRHRCRVASRSDGSKGHSHGMPAAVVRHPGRRDRRGQEERPRAQRRGAVRRRPPARVSAPEGHRPAGRPRVQRAPHRPPAAARPPPHPRGRPGDHAPPFASPDTRAARFTDADGTRHELRRLNGAPASASHPDIRASVTGYRETVIKRMYIARRHRCPDGPTHRVEGKQRRFSWVTDLPVDGDSPMPVTRAARSRWRTGNGTPARWGTRATAPGPASGTESGA